jgi:sec-independent protein translocase protein TatA
MISNVGDFLVVLVVFILLLAGDKNAGKTAKSIGKFLSQLRKSQEEFKNELIREINNIDDNYVNNTNFKYIRNVSQDKVRELEMRIKELQEELQRLKNNGGKN